MKKTFYIITVLLTVINLFSGCRSRKPEEPLQASDAETHYATLLQMQDLKKGTTLCRIQDPWQPQRVVMQYLLIPNDTLSDDEIDEIEREYGALQTLRTPVRQQTLTASCYAKLYEELDALPYIGVLCDAEYISDPKVKERLASGQIVEAGSSMAPNLEVILSAKSEAIWITPYEAGSQAMISSLLPQIPIIYCADYQETSPLARAEWMRFYGRLVGKTAQADSLFQIIEQHYIALSKPDSMSTIHVQSSIVAELPYGPTWYIPGGRSSASWLYQDAGFSYPWADDVHGGSLALSPEAVFDKAGNADLWVFKYYDPDTTWTMSSFLTQNPLYSQFHAAQTGQVYGCNTARSDYFEVAPFHPDWVLAELRHLYRQELDSLHYFLPIK